MTIKAIIFDMDGTIIDTEHIWHKATRNLIESKGVAYTVDLHEELSKYIHGLAMPKSIEVIKNIAKLEESVDNLMLEKNRIADDLFLQGVSFIEGFVDFHREIKKRDFKTAVATNAGDKTVELTDRALNLKHYFGEHIYNISCVGNICKPSPELYLHAAQKLETDPINCIAIEDSAHGITAAKRAGMFCIGINTSKNRNNLKEADLIIDAYSDIDLININLIDKS